jgi:hypothetical protein
MKAESTLNDALIFIQITSIANISDQKLGNVRLNLYLRRSKQVANSRIPIASNCCALHH